MKQDRMKIVKKILEQMQELKGKENKNKTDSSSKNRSAAIEHIKNSDNFLVLANTDDGAALFVEGLSHQEAIGLLHLVSHTILNVVVKRIVDTDDESEE